MVSFNICGTFLFYCGLIFSKCLLKTSQSPVFNRSFMFKLEKNNIVKTSYSCILGEQCLNLRCGILSVSLFIN